MLISVVVPTLNRPGLLLEAAKSIAGQDYPEWEAVIVDDGSTPAVDQAALRSVLGNRLTVVRHERPKGIPEAKNAGLRASAGEVITYLDDDDLLAENALSNIAAAFDTHKDLDCVFLNVKPFGRYASGSAQNQLDALAKLLQRVSTREQNHLIFFEQGLFEALLKSVPLALQRPAARRGAWNIVGGYTTGLLFSEPDWAIRASTVCRMALMREPLSLWRCDRQNFASRPAMFDRAIENGVRSAELLSQWCGASRERSRTRARHVRRFLADAYFGQAYHFFQASGKLPWKALGRSFMLAPQWRHISLSLKSVLRAIGKRRLRQDERRSA